MPLNSKHLLLLVLIFYSTCIEVNEEDEKFKSFASIPNYAQQNIPQIKTVEEINPKYLSKNDFLEDIKLAKCIYSADNSKFDISDLCVNTLDESIKEVASHYEVDIDGSSYTILYNFCSNLKYTARCPYEKKQAYYIKDNV